jgi:hypothetical protein
MEERYTDLVDHFSGMKLYRPDGKSTMKYDFDFRKIGDKYWRYVNSTNNIDDFDNQIKVLNETGQGEYRIMNSITGELIFFSHSI